MKRGQFTLVGLSEKDLNGDPIAAAQELGFKIPDYAINCVTAVRIKHGSIRVMFFENSDEMLTQYTKYLLFRRTEDAVVSYYVRNSSASPWAKVPAPTLVSNHIETRMRQ